MTATETESSASSDSPLACRMPVADRNRQVPAYDGAVRWLWVCLIPVAILQAQDQPCAESADLERIFDQDQADRAEEPIDWSFVNPRDSERRGQVAKILGQSTDLCPVDLYRAAAVFQHGRRPNDFLFAHVLASAAAVRGHEPARWMSAATLDRYLTRVGQAQIFGTQFNRMPGEPWTQEPMSPEVVPDSIRTLFNVPVRAKQRARLERLGSSDRPSATVGR